MDPSKLITCMVPFVIQQLASPVIAELAKIWNVDKELGELLATYCSIQDMLGIREGRLEIKGFTLEPWLQELEGYLYDTEDLVNALLLSCPTSGVNENHGKHPIRDRILKSPLSIKPLTNPRKIVELRQDLDRISSRIGKVLGAAQNNSKQPSSDPPYKSMLSDNMPFIPGTSRDQDKTAIVEKLIKCHRSGVSIVGIDGLGKTSLARTILVDETIKSHFPLILSASVSGDFHMTQIVNKLVANYLETSPQTAESHRGGAKLLQEHLCEGRALIILDDLWSVIDEDWQRFECNYLNLCPGGKILITTPNPKVAEVTRSIAHDLVSMTWLACQLVSVYLENCPNCQVLPSLGQLPILTNLVLHSIPNVQNLDDQFCGQGKPVFPCLESLEFHNMTQLAHWTGLRGGDMPCLCALKIVCCPKLLNLPSFAHLSCLMNLEINNCPKLQLLPELPSSLNGEFGELIITNSDLVKERCKDGGADWPKIKHIPYVEIDETIIVTKSSSQPLVNVNDKNQGTTNEDQSTLHQNQMTSNNDDLQGHGWKPKRRSSGGFHRYLFRSFSKVE